GAARRAAHRARRHNGDDATGERSVTDMSSEAAAVDRIVPGLRRRLREVEPRPLKGRLTRIVGPLIHAVMTEARLGELCELRDPHSGVELAAEIIGFDGETVLLTPIGDMTGLSTRTEVIPTGRVLQVAVGDVLLGRVVDALGRPLDVADRGALPTA